MKEYHLLYPHGKYPVRGYYKYHFFDPMKVCKMSYLCRFGRKPNKAFRRPSVKLGDVVNKLLEKKVDLSKLVNTGN